MITGPVRFGIALGIAGLLAAYLVAAYLLSTMPCFIGHH